MRESDLTVDFEAVASSGPPGPPRQREAAPVRGDALGAAARRHRDPLMNRLQSLAQRRLELVERSRVQRAALIAGAVPLLDKAAALDRIVASARKHPVVTMLGAGAVEARLTDRIPASHQ